MHRARRPFFHLAAIVGVAMLTACASGPSSTAKNTSDLTVKFAYRGIGVGPTALAGAIELERGTESHVASRAIINAVQSLEFGFLEPVTPSLDTLLPPGKLWTTDVLPIERAAIDAYNKGVSAQLTVPINREYGLQYMGEYAIVDRELRFNIAAKLFQKGASGNRHPYTRDYSGDYFIHQLKDAIRAALTAKPAPALPLSP